MRFHVALPAVLALAACVQMTPISDAKPISLSPSQVAQIKSAVTYDFFDPSSAQFRNLRAVDVTLKDGKTARRVCGEVNGRNQLGGYSGFQMFGGEMVNGAFQKQDFFSPCESW